MEKNNKITEYSELLEKAISEAEQIVSGQQNAIKQILITIICGGHILIEGVPGTGKTLAAATVSRILELGFKRIQFTPDLMPADITGTTVFDRNSGKFFLRKGPIFSDIILADEINRAPAKTQAALLEAMQEKKVTIDTETNELSEHFTCIATQNPIDMEGTYPLPEAEIDRFMMKINIDYPGEEQEKEILKRYRSGVLKDSRKPEVSTVLTAANISELKTTLDKITVEDNIIDYITALVRNTRTHSDIENGASPRSAVALFSAAKASALLEGRDFVIPEDVKSLASPVLAHRLILTTEAEMSGRDTSEIIKTIIESTEVPQ
jgi:MoxR-like ATPase